ncbi:aldehyde dehydrogenase family protein [Acidiferrimicrobium sp. IK]|uniref:aldehyde dehydrogenase family protein n=1 Tax=Acidiferrimicrobium sp. IK TaxID=2871700 RepID=UPI0021CB0602|nr:aldehyde dehydrogenase family protein [Acidiferrimicrobium sp. IK]MCU4187242.1 aldehyde dehydrogenase family protein [Acidiferrimicrobium sp. IK]
MDIRSVNPAAPSDVVAEIASTTPDELEKILDAAVDAQLGWARTTPSRRAAVMGAIAAGLAASSDELVALIVREEGKTVAEATVEVIKSAEQFTFAAQLAYMVEGTQFPEEEPGTAAYTLRSPLGVVGAITPWNFPLSLPARKLAAALAVGNAAVFKPSPVVAAAGDRLVRIINDAGMPAGLLGLVQGADPATMAALAGDPRLRAVTFTGSDGVGERLAGSLHRFARIQMELGGRNAAVVAADADLKRAATDIAKAAFGQAGQTCTATDRVLVERSVADRLTEMLSARVSELVVGPGVRPDVSFGPVATAEQKSRLEAVFASARHAGCRLLAQGRIAEDVDPDGYWVAPVLYGDVPADHRLLREEMFGPVLSIVAVDSVAEAVRDINADGHGLVAALHTASLTTASRFARDVRCGLVKINGRTTGNGVAPPFGGWRASSSGAFPEGGRQAIDFFTETKTVYSTYD